MRYYTRSMGNYAVWVRDYYYENCFSDLLRMLCKVSNYFQRGVRDYTRSMKDYLELVRDYVHVHDMFQAAFKNVSARFQEEWEIIQEAWGIM